MREGKMPEVLVKEFMGRVNHLKANPTHWEKLFRSFLDRKKINYKFQSIKVGVGIVDFYLPDYRLVVEIDGVQHSWLENIQKDIFRDVALAVRGYQVMRIPNRDTVKDELIKEHFKRFKILVL